MQSLFRVMICLWINMSASFNVVLTKSQIKSQHFFLMKNNRQLIMNHRHNNQLLLYWFTQEQTREKQAQLKFKLLWWTACRALYISHLFDSRTRPHKGFHSSMSALCSVQWPCSDSAFIQITLVPLKCAIWALLTRDRWCVRIMSV